MKRKYIKQKTFISDFHKYVVLCSGYTISGFGVLGRYEIIIVKLSNSPQQTLINHGLCFTIIYDILFHIYNICCLLILYIYRHAI